MYEQLEENVEIKVRKNYLNVCMYPWNVNTKITATQWRSQPIKSRPASPSFTIFFCKLPSTPDNFLLKLSEKDSKGYTRDSLRFYILMFYFFNSHIQFYTTKKKVSTPSVCIDISSTPSKAWGCSTYCLCIKTKPNMYSWACNKFSSDIQSRIFFGMFSLLRTYLRQS